MWHTGGCRRARRCGAGREGFEEEKEGRRTRAGHCTPLNNATAGMNDQLQKSQATRAKLQASSYKQDLATTPKEPKEPTSYKQDLPELVF